MNEFRKKSIAGLLSMALITSGFSGCTKTVECDIDENHAHKYVNSKGQITYVDSEKEKYRSHIRVEDYILIDQKEEELRNFEFKKGLYRIEENIDYINSIQDNNHDFVEYRYSYTYLRPIPHIISTGKTTTTFFTYIPTKGHNWTTDKNHSNLTGEQRVVHHVYYGYKIDTDGDKMVVLKSKKVDNIYDLPEEYKYIKKDFCEQINIDDGTILDYEDGPESNHKMPGDVDESEIETEKGQSKVLTRE